MSTVETMAAWVVDSYKCAIGSILEMELTGLGNRMAVGKRGRSIRRLPTRTLSRISKANVY